MGTASSPWSSHRSSSLAPLCGLQAGKESPRLLAFMVRSHLKPSLFRGIQGEIRGTISQNNCWDQQYFKNLKKKIYWSQIVFSLGACHQAIKGVRCSHLPKTSWGGTQVGSESKPTKVNRKIPAGISVFDQAGSCSPPICPNNLRPYVRKQIPLTWLH